MIVKQIKLSKMATFCYLIGDEKTGACAAVDPAFETQRILRLVQEAEWRLVCVINTHAHADHTAGNASMVKATGAELLIHEADARRLGNLMNAAFSKVLGGNGSPKPDRRLKQGDLITVGRVKLKVLHTPGHTPGGICLYGDGQLFTGDTLFVGGVGRTDLPGGSARQLLKSIREKIYSLPGDTVIWPGHDYGITAKSTVAQEMRTNPFTRQPE